MMSSNRLLGITIGACASALLVYTLLTYSWDAALYPAIVLVLMVACAAVLFFASMVAERQEASLDHAQDGGKPGSEEGTPKDTAVFAIVILLLGTAAIPWLGFYTSCFLTLIIAPMASGDGMPSGAAMAKDVVFAVLVVVAVYVIFDVWLDLRPPQGWII